MDFLRRLFSLKRTKMVDEAAYNHIPTPMGRSILHFVVVAIIASLLVGILQSIPIFIYLMTDKGILKSITVYLYGDGTMEDYANAVELAIFNMPPWVQVASLFISSAYVLVAIFYCKKYEKRGISSMGIRKNGFLPEFLIGYLIGAGMLTVSLLFAYATRGVDILWSSISFEPIIILFFLAFIFQAFGEEMLFRGYFMTSVARDYRPAVAVAVSSVAFSLMHLGNSGAGILSILNTFLMGFFLGAYVFKRGSIVGATAIHAAWNFVQGNIFGVSVSGMNVMPSVIKVTPINNLALLSGGTYGIEGGLCATVIIIIATVLLLLTKTKNTEISDFEVNF